MTRSDYQELVEFLAPKFGRIEQRFDAIEERLTRVEVLGEEDRDRSRILAEAISSLNGKVDALRDTMADEFLAVRTEMKTGFRVVRAETAEGFERLGSRVTRLESLQA
jgi:hypothetical protein